MKRVRSSKITTLDDIITRLEVKTDDKEIIIKGNFPFLEFLDIILCKAENVIIEGKFPSLEYISVWMGTTKNVTINGDFPALKYLEPTASQIEDITVNGKFPKLRAINLSHGKNIVTHFKADFPVIETICVWHNDITCVTIEDSDECFSLKKGKLSLTPKCASKLQKLELLHDKNLQFPEELRSIIV